MIRAASGWVGRGSVTSQPGSKKKKGTQSPGPRKKKKAGSRAKAVPTSTGNGLTIREKIERADRKVRTLTGEIAQAKRRLAALERDLAKARGEAEAMRDLPRKSAIGIALHEAEKAARDQ